MFPKHKNKTCIYEVLIKQILLFATQNIINDSQHSNSIYLFLEYPSNNIILNLMFKSYIQNNCIQNYMIYESNKHKIDRIHVSMRVILDSTSIEYKFEICNVKSKTKN